VDRALFGKLLVEAWRRIAPKRVVAAWDADHPRAPAK
jgi:hypothetical protein